MTAAVPSNVTRPQLDRELLRVVPKMPLHPEPPTVTLMSPTAPSSVTSPRYVDGNSPVFRWTGCSGFASSGTGYFYGVMPTGSSLDQGRPFFVDFNIDAANFEIQLRGNGAGRGYRLWVDGQPLTSGVQAGPAGTGENYPLRLNFGGVRKPRHIRLFTNAGVVCVVKTAVDTMWAPTRPLYTRRAYFLGDSFTGGANATLELDGYVYQLCDRLGWEPLNGGQNSTGYANAAGGTGGRATFAARATNDVVPAAPDVVVIYGGTNDVLTGLQAAASSTFSALANGLPSAPVYVFGVQYAQGGADATRDGKDAAIQSAAQAAPNVKLFQSVKTWFTGTGRVGAPAGDGNADVFTSSDGLHPSSAGHAYTAARMAEAIIPTYAAG